MFLHCKKLNFDNVLIYTWHLLHFCPSWERDPSHVALSEVSTFFLPVKRFFFSSFSLLLLRVKGRGCHTLLKPYETNCGLWIWAIQIKFDWLIDWLLSLRSLPQQGTTEPCVSPVVCVWSVGNRQMSHGECTSLTTECIYLAARANAKL